MIRVVLLATLALALSAQDVDYRGSYTVPLTSGVLQYDKPAVNNAVSRLQQKLEKGEVRLEWDEQRGYLPAVLRELKVPVSSQMLVFSRTSLQLKRISPDTPRALYFNDDVYVGWVPEGEVMEISAADTELGGVFFVLRQEKTADSPLRARRPVRAVPCLRQHDGRSRPFGPQRLLRSGGLPIHDHQLLRHRPSQSLH